jgi:hypothetical protein
MTVVDLNPLREKMIQAGLSDGHFKMMGLEPPEIWGEVPDLFWKFADKDGNLYFKFKPDCDMHSVTNGRVMVYSRPVSVRFEDTGEQVPSNIQTQMRSNRLLMKIPRDNQS